MNNFRKLFAIFSIIVIIVCAMAACDSLGSDLGSGSGSGPGPGSSGNKPDDPNPTPTTPPNQTTVAVTGVSLKSTTSLVVGGTETLYAAIDPPIATNQNVTWDSGNGSVATVSASGTVTAVAAGTATITVTTVDGNKTASCTVNVSTSTVAVTGVTLNKSSISLNAGGAETLIPTITPSNATNQNVTWTSSNVSAATVSSGGLVTAVAAGTATITVTTVDGNKTAACTVTVTVPATPPDSTIHTFDKGWDFYRWLNEQPTNTKTTPYNVKLNLSESPDESIVIGSPGSALRANAAKYVSLDLSDSTFTNLERYAFFNCSSLTSVTLPDSVTLIRNEVFKRCTSLTEVTIPSSVTFIGTMVFGECTSLKAINVASENRTYTAENGVLLYYKKDRLHTYPAGKAGSYPVIPNSVTEIGEGAFYGCNNLTSVDIPNGVTYIGCNAFQQCTSLVSVTIPNSVYAIREFAFAYCTSLTSVTIPQNVSIDQGMFIHCSSLKSINVAPSGSEQLFSENGVLYSSMRSGTQSTFGLTLLQYPAGKIDRTFTIPDGVKNIMSYAFGGCKNLTGVTLPDSANQIWYYAFKDCTSLTSITIPDSVTEIWAYAFMNCTSLGSVTIGSSVSLIGGAAFVDCTSLTSVTFKGTIDSNGFQEDIGDLRAKYLAGGPGTYTRAINGSTWTKKQ